MADSVWSDTPPTAPGWYWVLNPICGGVEITAELRDDLWWWGGNIYKPQILPKNMKFGPRIPSAEELAALSKLQRRERPDDSEIDAVLREAFGIHDVDRSTKLEETK